MDLCFMEALIQEVAEITDKYNGIHQQESFNVFRITGLDTKEVRICRLICELLDKDGCHGQKSEFLKLFCKYVLEMPKSDSIAENLTVEYEWLTKEDRRIDIFLKGNGIAIPIEVKINAIDQTAQLVDYFEYAQNSPIYYLTLDAHQPSKDSIKSKRNGKKLVEGQYRCISFGYHVLNWLNKCMEVEGNSNSLNEILRQFAEAIQIVVGKENAEMKTEIVELLKKKPEYIAAIKGISDALPSILADKMKEIFDTVKKHYEEKNYIVRDYYSEKVEGYYAQKTTTWPSLCIQLPDSITNGYKLDLRIEVDHHMYIGVSNRLENTDFGNDHSVRDTVHKQRKEFVTRSINPYNLSNDTESFYWWCYITTKSTKKPSKYNIDFRNCNEKYMQLYTRNGFDDVMEKIYCTVDEILEKIMYNIITN